MHTILRLPAVQVCSGYSRSSLYRSMAMGLFPRSVKLGGRFVGWPEHEIDAVNTARIAGKTDDEVRFLVSKMAEERKK